MRACDLRSPDERSEIRGRRFGSASSVLGFAALIRATEPRLCVDVSIRP